MINLERGIVSLVRADGCEGGAVCVGVTIGLHMEVAVKKAKALVALRCAAKLLAL